MVWHFPVITLFGFLSIAKRFSLHLLVADAPLSNEMAQKWYIQASLLRPELQLSYFPGRGASCRKRIII